MMMPTYWKAVINPAGQIVPAQMDDLDEQDYRLACYYKFPTREACFQYCVLAYQFLGRYAIDPNDKHHAAMIIGGLNRMLRDAFDIETLVDETIQA